MADITNVLAHGADSNGLVVVKLKHKLNYQGHVYFEAVRPETVQALLYLRQNNALYSDIDIVLDNIPSDLLSVSVENKNDKTLERSDCLEEDQNPLYFHRFNSQETIMISNSSTSEELGIAPGEGKQQRSILNDNFCEELAFPYCFPNGRFGYKVEREIKLSPVNYFNQQLFNFTQMFASDPDYVFLHCA